MSTATKISWSQMTWNPIRARLKGSDRWGYHCERISPGCQHCYASTMNGRMLPAWGTGLDYTVPNRDKVEIFLDEKELLKPLSWKKPRRVFPCSMTDLFAAFVPDEMIDQVFAVAALTPQHTYQVLTKRADRMEEYFAERWIVPPGSVREWAGALARVHKRIVSMLPTLAAPTLNAIVEMLDAVYPESEGEGFLRGWPLKNVWLGVSVEDQKRADERIPHLLRTPAAVRFLSCEPLLEQVRLRWEWVSKGHPFGGGPMCDLSRPWEEPKELPGIDWVITGCESGHGARSCDEGWVRLLRDQCQAAGTAFFYKQAIINGKKVETPELDGRRWVEFPEVQA